MEIHESMCMCTAGTQQGRIQGVDPRDYDPYPPHLFFFFFFGGGGGGAKTSGDKNVAQN